ncbi:MAG TPA: hypothetical protein VM286_04165 [Candidatus Thermoplasmatota archaeon]|nr:hypothetical protein [Candidatus Thermoplasmatota archaeon]
MRALAVLAVLLLAGCFGHSTGTQAPLPEDFTVTQPAAAIGTAESATYTIDVASAARLNATLVWSRGGNHLNLDVSAGGSSGGQGVVSGTTAHLEHDLYPGTYALKVVGTPAEADTWHLEVHFTRK